MRTKTAIAVVALLFTAACGGGGVSVDDGPSASGGSVDEFCAILEGEGQSFLEGMPDDDFSGLGDVVDRLQDAAPAEIRGDLELVAEVTDVMVDAFEGLDPDDPAAFERLIEIGEQFEDRQDEITAAGENLETWAQANCDLPDETGGSLFGGDATSYGDDPELDALYDDCADGDLAACDRLWLQAPFGSEYERFGDTCGETTDSASGSCEFLADFGTESDADADADADADEVDSDADDVDLPGSYGDDSYLDGLYDNCADGDMAACDDLFFASPIDSDYEAFAHTCGGTVAGPESGTCDGGPEPSDAVAYGDDPYLDSLYDGCDDGEMDACDSLYFSAPIGSDYESFGRTCGGRTDGLGGSCVEPGEGDDDPYTYGDDATLDVLYDDCDDGDMDACDNLYFSSPIGSDYEFFGETCGGRTEDIGGFCGDPLPGADDDVSYGDDAVLDGLYDGCKAGDLAACDDLWWESPVGSEYETFAESCGGRSSEPVYADCEATL